MRRREFIVAITGLLVAAPLLAGPYVAVVDGSHDGAVLDARVYHGVTPIKPLDKTASAHRDALVVTFRKAGWEAESHSTAPCPRRRGT